MKRYFTFVTFSLLILFLTACGDDDGPQGINFDRSALLENYADNFIQPAIASLVEQVGALRNQISTFSENTAESELTGARNNWITAYTAWQSVNSYNFGPGGEEGLRRALVEELGTFPVTAEDIDANIIAGTTSMDNIDRTARGFLTLEYLLYGENESLQDILAKFNTDANRRAYILAVADDALNRIITLNNDWNSYRGEFIASDGTSSGSSTSALYNEFVRSFEAVKNFKVGLPAGKRAGQTSTEPELVEAFYSGLSLDMLKAHIASIEAIYFGSDNLGFVDYLQAAEGGADLVSLTEDQWAVVKTALNNVPTDRSFSQLITEEHSSIDALHTELQKHTRFFKSDMSSLLGIAITFSSGDGD